MLQYCVLQRGCGSRSWQPAAMIPASPCTWELTLASAAATACLWPTLSAARDKQKTMLGRAEEIETLFTDQPQPK